MDSLSQPSAISPPKEPPVVQSIEPPSSRRVVSADVIARVVLFSLFIATLLRQLSPAPPDALVYPLLVYGLLSAAYLLASVSVVASEIQRQAVEQPLMMALLSLILLLPVMVYARSLPDFDPTELLFAGVLILLPTACAILNVPELRRADISLGLITVALPLVLPLARDTNSSTPVEAPTSLGLLLRVGAFLLPVLLLLLTTREQKQRLNFLFICAALSLWYAVEFDAFPAFAIASNVDVPYFQFAVVPLFLFVLSLAGRFDRLGLSFQPTPRNVSVVTANLGLCAAIAVPFGLVTGVLRPAFNGPSPLQVIVQAVTIYLLIALPREILFRGTLLTYLADTLRLDMNVTVAVISLIFGLSYLNHALAVAAPWYWLVALTTITGVFYARAFLATRNVAASAVVHAAVNWLWWLLFRG